MRAISAPTRAARLSKFSGQFAAQVVELGAVAAQRRDTLTALFSGRRRIASCTGEGRVEMVFGDLEQSGRRPQKGLRLGCGGRGGHEITREDARLQLADPVQEQGDGQARIPLQVSFEPAFVEILFVERAKCRRQPLSVRTRPSCAVRMSMTSPNLAFSDELQSALGVFLHLGKRIAGRDLLCNAQMRANRTQ